MKRKEQLSTKIKAYTSILMGVFFSICVLIGYTPIPEYAIELTCFSNTCIGFLLFFTGIRLLKKAKFFPSLLYHMGLVAILFVCIVSCVGRFNFSGAFFFLHLINPLGFLTYYLFFIEDTKGTEKVVLAPMPVMGYLFFDYIVGRVRGKFVYGIFEVHEITLIMMIMIGCGAYISLLLIALVTQYLNKKIKVSRGGMSR